MEEWEFASMPSFFNESITIGSAGCGEIVQSTRAAHGDIAALQANSSVGKLGSGVVFGHHGTALIAGACIHDLHNNVPSQVL